MKTKQNKNQHIASSRNGVSHRCWLDPWRSELGSDSLWTSSLQNPTHNTHKSAKVGGKKQTNQVSLSFPLKLLKVSRFLLKGQRGRAPVLSCPKALLFVRCLDTYNNKHELWTLNTFTALFTSQVLQQTLRNKYTFMGKHFQGPLV